MQCPRCSRNSHPPTSVLGRTMSSGGWELLHCTGGLGKPQCGAAYQDSMCTAPLSQTQGSFPTRQNKQEGQHTSEQTYEIVCFQTHFTHKETGSGMLRESPELTQMGRRGIRIHNRGFKVLCSSHRHPVPMSLTDRLISVDH